MATLYRNFPGRRELLEALYSGEVDTVCASATDVVGATAGERCTAWLREFFAFVASKQHVAAELLQHTDASAPVFGDSRTRVTAAGQPLLAAAQKTGEIRKDLSLDQVLDLIHAIGGIRGDDDYVEAILAAALAGLAGRTER